MTNNSYSPGLIRKLIFKGMQIRQRLVQKAIKSAFQAKKAAPAQPFKKQ
jgi:hypothetical protein